MNFRTRISNARLLSMADGQVSFHWKDYADGQRTKVMCLTAEEFLRRFLLHVLPPRFVRIRHYGILAGRNVDTKLARCRQLLGAAAPSSPAVPKTWSDWVIEWTDQDPLCCPRCQAPLIRLVLDPVRASPVVRVSPLARVDSS